MVSNPIYQEIIPRMLTSTAQDMLPVQAAWFVTAQGRLDMGKLMEAFQEFFREHSEHWIERFDYKEAGPQLLLQAFLQRIVNAGGRIEREYGLGRMRTDLLVIWQVRRAEERGRMADDGEPVGRGRRAGDGEQEEEGKRKRAEEGRLGAEQRIVIELKVLHRSRQKTLSEGLEQTFQYMDRAGTEEGHLVIFDRRPDRTWEERIYHSREEYAGKTIGV